MTSSPKIELDEDGYLNIDPLNWGAKETDQCIAYLRRTLARHNAGEKPQKTKPQVDTSKILAAIIPKEEKPKLRRI
jgi:hypothetical protein